jgi:hypothetical protein
MMIAKKNTKRHKDVEVSRFLCLFVFFVAIQLRPEAVLFQT